MNKVFLIGNLTRDPELSETINGTSVCKFSIAVNRDYTNSDGERQTDFFNVTSWHGLAENIARYTKKGSKVAVIGSIQMRTYDDNHGVRRTAVYIIAQDIEFLSAKNGSVDKSNDLESTNSKSAKKSLQRQMAVFDDDGSDIPF